MQPDSSTLHVNKAPPQINMSSSPLQAKNHFKPPPLLSSSSHFYPNSSDHSHGYTHDLHHPLPLNLRINPTM